MRTRTPLLAPDEIWSDLVDRLKRRREARPLSATSWDLGTPSSWLAALLDEWQTFDAGSFQDRIDGLEHRFVDLDGQRLHVAVASGEAPDPLPLLLTNGWPSSFLEFLELLPLLTNPTGDGAPETDGFTVVMPALPGYGFSGPPVQGGLTGRRVAGLWRRLMVDVLGYEKFVAHGSDLGSGITTWLARDNPDCVSAIHLASPHLRAPTLSTDDEQERFANHLAEWAVVEGGYSHIHSSKPGTLAAGLTDSPVGLAAWIGEKMVAWSSEESEGDGCFPRQLLLANLTLYWSTGTIGTSMLPYWAYSHTDDVLPIDDPSPVPTAVTIFRGERVPFPQAPVSLGRRYLTIDRWTEHATGGHFPAASVPRLLAQELRESFRPYRR